MTPKKVHPTRGARLLEAQAVRSAFKVAKPREYGSPKDVAARAISEVGGIQRVMLMLGLGRSTVTGFTDPDAERCDIKYVGVRTLTEAGARAFVDDLAAIAGGVFMPVDDARRDSVAALSAVLSRDAGDYNVEAFAALEDGTVDDGERLTLIASLDRMIADVTRLRNALRRAK